MSNRKSYVKLALLMFVGAVIGISGNMFVSFFGDDMENLTSEFGTILQNTGTVIEVMVAVISALVVIGIYSYIRRLWKLEQEADDEVADEYGERFDFWVQIGITITDCISGVLLVLGCCAIPGRMSPYGKDGMLLIGMTSVMILGCAFMAVMEIKFYHLMQKRDPQKKGDPSSFKFNKQWLEGCDETEKLVIYQAGYKAFGCVQVALIVGILLALFGEVQFGTGKFPLVLMGIIWIMGTASFGIWKMRGLSSRKSGKEK